MRDADLRFIAFLAVFVGIATTAIACDPGPEITWVNQTDETVVVYLRDEFDRDLGTALPPHSTKMEGVIEGVWNDVVVIRDEQGNLLFRQKLSWDELDARGFRFVITEDMLSSASPTPVPSPTTAPGNAGTSLPAEASTAGSAPGPKPAERQGGASVSNSPTQVATENEAVTGTQVQPPFGDDTAESVKVARQDLAQRLGVSVESVVVPAVIGQEFSTDAFYCRTTKDRIAKEDSPAVMTGFVILLNVSGRRYEYHASGSTVIFCRPLP